MSTRCAKFDSQSLSVKWFTSSDFLFKEMRVFLNSKQSLRYTTSWQLTKFWCEVIVLHVLKPLPNVKLQIHVCELSDLVLIKLRIFTASVSSLYISMAASAWQYRDAEHSEPFYLVAVLIPNVDKPLAAAPTLTTRTQLNQSKARSVTNLSSTWTSSSAAVPVCRFSLRKNSSETAALAGLTRRT